MKGSSSRGVKFETGGLFRALWWSFLWSTLMTWEKLGLNDRRGRKVQLLGHEAEKCDCVSFWLAGISWIPNFSCSALFSVYPDDLECSTSEHELLLSIFSNACDVVSPQQREMRWNCIVMSTLVSWGHSAFQNNPNYTNLPLSRILLSSYLLKCLTWLWIDRNEIKRKWRSDGEMFIWAVRVIQTSVSVGLFCWPMSPGQYHALDSCSLSMTGQNWLAAEFGSMEDLQQFGICHRGNEQDNPGSKIWGRKEILSVLSIEEEICVGFGLLLLQKFLTKGSSRREKGKNSGCSILNDSLESGNRESWEEFL